jgi:hypothetical protein
MIETKTYNPPIALVAVNLSDGLLELSRLLAAAVINPEFCRLLLNNPELALQRGFQGEGFFFTEYECNLILSIRADSLSGLANQLARIFTEHLQIHLNPAVQAMAVYGF